MAEEPKKKKKKPVSNKYVVFESDGKTAEIVEVGGIVDAVRNKPGCAIYGLTRQVKTLLVFAGKEDLLTGKKGEDKVLIKYTE